MSSRASVKWCCAGLAAIAGTMLFFPGISWKAVKARIKREYPEVRSISTEQLAASLSARVPVTLLLDVRTPAEFAVSHLPGARRIDPEAQTFDLDVSTDAPIVTYCSVGYRSARTAQRLRSAGFQNVRNLDGSLFQWANEGRAVVRDNAPAQKVHPYNRLWGRLLNKERRADVPPAK